MQWIGTLLLLLLGICLPHRSRAAAISAVLNVDLGTSAEVDSYDSSDPAKSTNGQYDLGKVGMHGDITSNLGIVMLHSSFVYGSIRTNAHFVLPAVLLPSTAGITPTAGSLVSLAGTNLYITASATNSLTPPPYPATNQTIVATTNISYATTSTYPYGTTVTGTNKTVAISGTNRIVVMVSSNAVCGTNTYSGNSLPTNACSFTRQGNGGFTNFHYTLIEGTNIVYNTNLTYTYTTNYTYTFQQYVYNYTIYTASPVYQTNYYDQVLCGTSYVADSLSGLTAVTCPSELVMPNGFQMSAGDQIVILPGASLTIYSGGTNCIINADAITNQSALPAAFLLYGVSGTTNVTINGTHNFSGVVIAPLADMKINSTFGSPLNFFGAVMVKSFAVSGGLNFHYDEALGQRLSPPAPVGAVKSPNGYFSFNALGDRGVVFTVQASTNLVDWTSVGTYVGPFQFIDINSISAEKRFYRVVWQ